MACRSTKTLFRDRKDVQHSEANLPHTTPENKGHSSRLQVEQGCRDGDDYRTMPFPCSQALNDACRKGITDDDSWTELRRLVEQELNRTYCGQRYVDNPFYGNDYRQHVLGTCLAHAVAHVNVLQWLSVEYDAVPTAQALIAAVEGSHDDAVSFLMEHSSDSAAFLNTKVEQKGTPFVFACRQGNLRCVQRFCEALGDALPQAPAGLLHDLLQRHARGNTNEPWDDTYLQVCHILVHQCQVPIDGPAPKGFYPATDNNNLYLYGDVTPLQQVCANLVEAQWNFIGQTELVDDTNHDKKFVSRLDRLIQIYFVQAQWLVEHGGAWDKVVPLRDEDEEFQQGLLKPIMTRNCLKFYDFIMMSQWTRQGGGRILASVPLEIHFGLALQSGSVDMLKLVLKHHSQATPTDILTAWSRSFSALLYHEATSDIVAYLLDEKIIDHPDATTTFTFTARDERVPATALCHVVLYNWVDGPIPYVQNLIRVLLERGANPNSYHNGATLLEIAASRDDGGTCLQLLAHGAQRNVRSSACRSVDDCSYYSHGPDAPLGSAAHFGDCALIEALLAPSTKQNEENLPADVNASVDRYGNTALHKAFDDDRPGSCLQTVQLLLQRGARVDAANKLGDTALHRALVNEGNADGIQLLLDLWASLDLPNQSGRTPRQVAHEGYTDLLQRDPIRRYDKLRQVLLKESRTSTSVWHSLGDKTEIFVDAIAQFLGLPVKSEVMKLRAHQAFAIKQLNDSDPEHRPKKKTDTAKRSKPEGAVHFSFGTALSSPATPFVFSSSPVATTPSEKFVFGSPPVDNTSNSPPPSGKTKAASDDPTSLTGLSTLHLGGDKSDQVPTFAFGGARSAKSQSTPVFGQDTNDHPDLGPLGAFALGGARNTPTNHRKLGRRNRPFRK